MWQNPAFETRPANKQEDLLAHPPRPLTPTLKTNQHKTPRGHHLAKSCF
jgi:hypothetical protein